MPEIKIDYEAVKRIAQAVAEMKEKTYSLSINQIWDVGFPPL